MTSHPAHTAPMHTNPNRTPASNSQRYRPTTRLPMVPPVHEAAERGDLEALAAISSEDPLQLRARDAFDRTPLLWAARWGHARAAAFILDHAVPEEPHSTSPDSHVCAITAEADHFGNAPLHVASREGHLEVVALLLARGADPAARNRYGWTPLIAASVNGRTEVVRALLAHGGSNVDARWGSWGLTALHQACFYHHADIVALLLENHADPRVVDRKGRRPLHVARGEAQPRIAAMLEVALEEPQRVQCLARARLLANTAHAQAATPLLSSSSGHEGGATAAARIARRRTECGAPPPVVSVAAGVLEGVVGLPDDMFLELLDLMGVPWDPARRKQRRRQRQRQQQGQAV